MPVVTPFRLADLEPGIQKTIWTYAALMAHDGPRVFHMKLEFETVQIHRGMGNGQPVYNVGHGPVLSFGHELVDDTKDQRALLMTCRAARNAVIENFPDRINFARPREEHELQLDYFATAIQYPLFIDAAVDIICLSAKNIRRYYKSRNELKRMEVYVGSIDRLGPDHWPLWQDLQNVAVDVTCTHDSVHPINYVNGQPYNMTVDGRLPKYKSIKLDRYVWYGFSLTADGMWMVLDEAHCLRYPDWTDGGALGRPARLLVLSEDGQRLVCVHHVVEPQDDDSSDDDTDADADDSDDNLAVGGSAI
ncbi:hypothetical protein VP1G_06620 [Cytospora mali]|uniref:Uncharacterized protein n=1 Tax=Cytospora mali TaxID=578113 RepID=A0A194V628_CYTMA|nr:hypothetical protein VP1G_06620 [Valsa mali var. pyri (nom. inval.)]